MPLAQPVASSPGLTRSRRAVLMRADREDQNCKIGKTSCSRLEPLAVLLVNPCGDDFPPMLGDDALVSALEVVRPQTMLLDRVAMPTAHLSDGQVSFSHHINWNSPDLNCHLRIY